MRKIGWAVRVRVGACVRLSCVCKWRLSKEAKIRPDEYRNAKLFFFVFFVFLGCLFSLSLSHTTLFLYRAALEQIINHVTRRR